MGLFLQIDINIFQEQRAKIDPDFAMALHELLDQYYPETWSVEIDWSDGVGWAADRAWPDVPLPGFDVT